MKSITKILLIISFVLILSGSAIFAISVAVGGENIMPKYDTKTYTEIENFNDISVKTKEATVVFEKSTDEKVKVICYENEKAPHLVKVVDGKLVIEVQNKKKWYDYIGFNFKSPKITIYLPMEKYGNLGVNVSTGDVVIPKDFAFENIAINGSTGDVECYSSSVNDIKIHISTGDIEVKGVTAKNLDLKVSTGEIEVENTSVENDINIKFSTDGTSLQNVTANNLTINGTTGDVDLNNVVITGKMNISNSTGDVHFIRCDAGEIKVRVTTGDVKGSLLSSKIFIVDTTTGKKQVPYSTEGGICEITTSTGDIIITIDN